MKITKDISEKVVAANRANATKSTGPITPEGKKRSRQNALKNGMYSRQLKLSDDEAVEFALQRRSLARELAPASALQCIAFEQIVVEWWRCIRALRVETRSYEARIATPQQNLGAEARDANPVMEWYGASREALRAGQRFLRDLRAEVAEYGLLHLEAEGPSKESVIRAFGPEFYDTLVAWKGLQPDVIALAVTLAAKERDFGFIPIPRDNNLVADPKLKNEMVTKLIDLQSQHLADLQRFKAASSSAEGAGGLADFCPRFVHDASRDLRQAVDWFLYLRSVNL